MPARWIALSVGVLILSVILAVAAGMSGLLGSGDSAGRVVEARVVTGQPCPSGTMELVRYTVDGQDRQARLDGCGHQPDEPIMIMLSTGAPDEVVRSADAATGQGRYGQRLGEVLMTLAGIAGAGYALLLRRGPRTPRVEASGTRVEASGTRVEALGN